MRSHPVVSRSFQKDWPQIPYFPLLQDANPSRCIFHVTRPHHGDQQPKGKPSGSPIALLNPIWCGVGEGDRRRLWEPGWCYEIHSVEIPECTSKGREPCCHTLELTLNLQEFSVAFCHALVWSHKSNVKFLSFFFCHHITPKRLDRFLSNWVDMFGMSLLERTKNISEAH